MPSSDASPVPAAPAGSNTVSPFIMTDNAAGLIAFVVDVFRAVDVADARTLDADGLVLHSELLIGDSLITIADRKADWPYTPAFTRVYVDDVHSTLERAAAAGARIVTEPTDFWGDVLSRFADPFGNLWWVYKHSSQAAWDDESGSEPAEQAWGENDDDASWEAYTTPELEYIHSTLVKAMKELHDPRSQR